MQPSKRSHKISSSKAVTSKVEPLKTDTRRNFTVQKIWMESLIIFLLGFILYSNTLSHGFALDDTMMITSNAYTKLGFGGLGKIIANDAFTGFHGEDKNLLPGGRYRPLSQLMFAVEYELFGENPVPGHLLNVILYALACMVLYKALVILLREEKLNLWGFSAPFILAALFTVHPLHTEAVANIKGRDEILTLLGFASLLWLSLKYVETKNKRLLWHIPPLFFLSLLSKESATAFLAAIPVLIIFRDKTGAKNGMKIVLWLSLGLIGYFALRLAVIGAPKGNIVVNELLNDPFLKASFSEKIATTLYTWIKYVALILFPHPLTHDYYPWHITYKTFANPAVIFSVVLFFGGAAYSLRNIKKLNLASAGFLLFVILFSPQSNLLINIGTFMNERFVFIALLGVLAIILWVIIKLVALKPQVTNIVGIVLILILATFSIKTVGRNGAWKDDFTLFTTDVKTSKNSAKVNTSAGGVLLEKAQGVENETAKQQLLFAAIPYLQKGVELHPGYIQARILLGNALLLYGNYKSAWDAYNGALLLSSGNSDAVTNIKILGSTTLRNRNYDVAEEVYGTMFQRFPNDFDYALGYAEALLHMQKLDKSQSILDSLEAVHPSDAGLLHLLGQLWGRYLAASPGISVAQRMIYLDKAGNYIKKAIAIDSTNYGMVENLGIVYGMRGDFYNALYYFNKALEMMKQEKVAPDADATVKKVRSENFSRLYRNIGDTYRNMGKTDQMAENYKRADEYLP